MENVETQQYVYVHRFTLSVVTCEMCVCVCVCVWSGGVQNQVETPNNLWKM